MVTLSQDDIKRLIRDIPDFPKPGILFRDITPLLQNGSMLQAVTNEFAERYANQRIDAVVAVESRGLIFGAALACRLGIGFIMVRKQGKLPAETIKATYSLEYGEDTLEVHADSLSKDTRIILMDDLLATGGTMGAVIQLVEHFGTQVIELAVVIELTALQGRSRLGTHPVFSLVQY